MLASGLPTLFNSYVQNCTWEGDNNGACQQQGRWQGALAGALAGGGRCTAAAGWAACLWARCQRSRRPSCSRTFLFADTFASLCSSVLPAVMYLQTARYLMKAAIAVQTGKPLTGSAKYLSDAARQVGVAAGAATLAFVACAQQQGKLCLPGQVCFSCGAGSALQHPFASPVDNCNPPAAQRQVPSGSARGLARACSPAGRAGRRGSAADGAGGGRAGPRRRRPAGRRGRGLEQQQRGSDPCSTGGWVVLAGSYRGVQRGPRCSGMHPSLCQPLPPPPPPPGPACVCCEGSPTPGPPPPFRPTSPSTSTKTSSSAWRLRHHSASSARAPPPCCASWWRCTAWRPCWTRLGTCRSAATPPVGAAARVGGGAVVQTRL